MRITISQPSTSPHTEACSTVATSYGGELLSGSDDCHVWRWNLNCEPLAKVVDVESCITVIKWMPGAGKKKGDPTKDMFVVACADGTFRFVSSQTGRIEKVEKAHTGAITALLWNPDGSSIVTAGEDGFIKTWSQAGIQRSILASVGKCIYGLVWGVDSQENGGECVLYAAGSDVVVKPLNPSVKKQLLWKAHNGVVLAVDWSRMTNLIVTGGEDGMYKVWDAYGRNLFTSSSSEYPTTSVSFAPNGESFAVGSFQSIRVCDKTGWTQCREAIQKIGSIMCMSWTPDGTQIVAGGGSGPVCIAQLVDRKIHWKNYSVTLSECNKLLIQDVNTENAEELEHRDRITQMCIGHGYLVVVTSTQCAVYDVNRWNNPVQFDLRDAVVSLQLSEKTFFLADCTNGLSIYTYEGRMVTTIKVSATLRPEMLTSNLIALSADTVALRDPTDAKKVVFYDATNGKQTKGAVVQHHMDILDVSLSQFGGLQERKLTFVDRNKDLYIAALQQSKSSSAGSHKLATMVSSMRWNDSSETLVALADGRLVTWYYPSVVFIDRDLLQKTKSISDDAVEFGRNDQIVDFFGTRTAIRRGTDGALLTFSVSSFPNLLFKHVAKNDFEGAVRLCRFVKDDALWGILAALAVKVGEINTAEICYAAIDEVDKLRYMTHIKEIPSPEGRQAELALFQRRLQEAERILLDSNLTFQAIEMHIRLYNWERALDIASERQTHVDTVLYLRQQHLEAIGKQESSEKFKALANTKIDADAVLEKMKAERQKEKQRPGSKPYSS